MVILDQLRNDARNKTDRDKDVERKRERRSEAARIEIPDVVNPARRESCLKDPEKFLKTYFANRYTIPFGRHHYDMIDTVISRARYGGRQAVAAPRGCGKSELVKGLLVFLVFAELVRFPLPVAATSDLSKKLYTDFRNKIGTNDLLYQDFPEVCHPVRELDGASQRAGKQHVNGAPTRIVWTAGGYLSLPHVPGSPYGGAKMSYFGLDSAFRGINIDGDRPDFVLIDDPETRESAKSLMQCKDREEIIDQDIAGLASQEDNLAIVVLTTVQNSFCLSYRLTDSKLKPAFNGLRYGMILNWPDNRELWDEYVAIRHQDQASGDEFGLNAVQFYLDNREKMDQGVEMLSSHFVEVTLEDGTQLVHSAIQQAFNKIADTSLEAYQTEYQNDPPQEKDENQVKLTAAIVSSRISGFAQNELPVADCQITLGLDIGDRYGHWAKVAWHGNAVGCVIDYGIMEVPEMLNRNSRNVSAKAKELAIFNALMEARTDLLAENPPDFCLIDAGDGDHTDAVYSFVLEVGGSPWAASKGWDANRFRMPPERTDKKLPFQQCYASFQPGHGLWLYNVNTEHWKYWLQQRFQVPTFNDQQQFNDGTLSLYSHDDKKRHLSFSHHIVAEERQENFIEGKGLVRKWVVVNRNNHYLDALALACAAGGCLGVKLIKRTELIETPKQTTKKKKPILRMPDGRAYLATER